jgi:peptidoglycan/LPS O-acetylase OafA/YrhL
MAEVSPAPVDDPASKPRQGTRLYALDGLRFAAALAVLFFHFTARSNGAWDQPVDSIFPNLSYVTGLGAFGVDLFFVISGFVILMTAWNADITKYVSSRVSRLFPAYWACVILSAFLLIVVWQGKSVSFTQAATNMTLVQRAFGVSDVDGVYWTLWAELRFYLLIAIFVLVGITTRRVLAFCVLWPVLGGIAMTTDSAFLSTVLVSEWAPLFAAGMALYVVKKEPRNLAAWLTLSFCALLSGGVSGQHTLDTIVNSLTNRTFPDIVGWVIPIASIALVGILTTSRFSRLGGKRMIILGALTYPLYLLHEYWGWWIIHLLHDALPPYVVLAIALALTVALAWAVYNFVEKRTVSRMRRRLDSDLRRLAKPAAADA